MLIIGYSLLQQAGIRIQPAQLEVVQRKFGMQAQVKIRHVGSAGLRIFMRSFHIAAHPGPRNPAPSWPALPTENRCIDLAPPGDSQWPVELIPGRGPLAGVAGDNVG